MKHSKAHIPHRLTALLLALVLCLGMMPSAFAAQQDSYHDPAEHWQEANNRTNELDANAVVTIETFNCGECGKATSFEVFRTPEYGELEQYRASRKANIACKQAIEQAITEHYANNHLDRKAVKEVVEQFGFDRTFYVLASTVRHKDWDERISADNKAWAKTIPAFEDMDAWGADRNAEFVVDRSHPGIINLFVDMARHEHLLTLPLSKEDIQKEAARILSRLQAEREPNSPDGTHFMAQISPDFLARAKTRDQNRLMEMLPFSSHSLSTVAGRVGVFVLISKDENRSQPLRRRKPSVREKLSEKPPASPVKKAPSKDREAR